MTKRDYILITQICEDNDRFDYAKFMDACQKEIDKSVLPSGVN